MANFDRLLREALASQDASSYEVRQVIYQSSRNALQKIIDTNRSFTLEAVLAQKSQLEASIISIETEYTAPQLSSEPEPVPKIPEEPNVIENNLDKTVDSISSSEQISSGDRPSDVPEDDPLHEIQQILESTAPKLSAPIGTTRVVTKDKNNTKDAQVTDKNLTSIQQVMPDEQKKAKPDQQEEENLPLGFSKRRKTQKRFFWALVIFLVLGLISWIGYILVTSVLDGSLFGDKANNGTKINPNSISRQADSENYITVIDALNLSSLNTSDRGKAQIVNQLNSDMIRINSVRDTLNRSEPALPILIQLQPGILQQISGKRVTVEIFAKSGGEETAHFAVGCEFGDLTECGRKRFLAGSQPNASVFAFQMDTIDDINQEMFLTLSTDTTNQASVTGKGDILDIVYIRLSVDP